MAKELAILVCRSTTKCCAYSENASFFLMGNDLVVRHFTFQEKKECSYNLKLMFKVFLTV